MSNVTRLRHALQMGQEGNKFLTHLDIVIAKAIDAAKVAGVPQSMVVAVLHEWAHNETVISVKSNGSLRFYTWSFRGSLCTPQVLRSFLQACKLACLQPPAN